MFFFLNIVIVKRILNVGEKSRSQEHTFWYGQKCLL